MKENKVALISQNTLIFRRLNIPFLQHGYNLHLSSLTGTVLWILQCKDNTCILYVQIIRRDMQIIIVNEVCYTGFILPVLLEHLRGGLGTLHKGSFLHCLDLCLLKIGWDLSSAK